MIKLRPIKSFLFVLMIVAGCKQSYDPQIPAIKSNFLVVEGYINAQGATTITLSRTLPLTDTSKVKPELNAQVTIAGQDNSTFTVREIGNGVYVSDELRLNNNQKYRLHIKTGSGGEYLSEYVLVKPTPPIDSINWKLLDDGVQIYVNTHNAQNNTRYYKWDYQETWEIHSAYTNSVKYVNGQVIGRSATESNSLYFCWRSQNSPNILLGSTAQLTEDVVSMAPIVFIPSNDEKTSVRYSILIKQYALDSKAYDFYKLMKSNTESLGSVFDPLPSNITGNITCVSNPAERVIGYIAAATVQQKRIFLSAWDVHSTYHSGCYTIYVVNKPDSLKAYFNGASLLPYQADPPEGFANGYFSSVPTCIDCTLRGISVKPAFW